jgi:hypothetical protein
MKIKVDFYYILGILQILIAVGAILSGIAFVIDPSGHKNGISTATLVNSPFTDFFFPGLFLLTFNGMGNLVSAFMSFIKIEVSGFLGLAFGIILMVWIVLQVYWMGYGSILQPVYFILGGVEAIIGVKLLRSVIKAE